MSDFETNPRPSPDDPDPSQPDEGVSEPSVPETRPQPPVHQGPYPPVSQTWHPGQPHHPGWPGNGGYGASAQPSGPPHSAPPAGLPVGASPAGPPHGGPPAGPHPAAGAGFPPPLWASQPAPAAVNRPPSRAGKAVAIGAAAVVLSVSSGLVGAVIANGMSDSSPTTTVNTRPAAAAPVIDRSSLAGIAEAVRPSVVSISTGSGEGSGVVLTKDGFILTNNHVVASATGDRVNVTFSNGKGAQATITGTDPQTDLAVVKASGVSDLRAATFGDSSAMRVGDTVLALGSPLGLQGSVTAGIVSALNRTIDASGEQRSPLEQPTVRRSMSGLLQTDAPINPGNSGGALVNTNGDVIGINTAIATSGQGQGNIGVGFAIPSNRAKLVAEQLMKGQKVSHPFLGVNVSDTENGGALISAVTDGGPAAKAGLQKGDVVVQIGATEINDSDDLVSAVQTGKVGDRLAVTYTRNGDQRTTTVTLGEAS